MAARPVVVDELEPRQGQGSQPDPESAPEPAPKPKPGPKPQSKPERRPEPTPAPQPTPQPPATASVPAGGSAPPNNTLLQQPRGRSLGNMGHDNVGEVRGRTGTIADTPPSYRSKLRAWLARHKVYPWRARRLHMEGTVVLYFVMAWDGRVLNLGNPVKFRLRPIG